jgi:transforming growth factor-beta-induced protein
VDATAATAAATAGDAVTGLGGTLQLGLDGSNIVIDGAATVAAPNAVVTDNGIIHGISAVLLPSVTDIVVSDSNFSSLATALTVADTDTSAPALVSTLDGAGTFTVFAPTNAAFSGLVSALSGSASTGITGLGDFASYQLIPVLKYHVLTSTVLADAAVAAATNGDAVTTLGGSLQLGLSGSSIQLDGGALVTVANLFTSNGVIHVIDQVLVPSIVDVVTTAPEFSSLVGAVLAADGDAGTSPKVSVALDAPAASGAYTLFAPNNAAFSALGAAPSGQALTNVLLYHVLNEGSAIYAADAVGLASPTAFNTLLGSSAGAQLTVAGGSGVSLDDAGSSVDANVTEANYFTSNGVIHVVDKVLLPGMI